MPAEAELQRADADARACCELQEVERLVGMRVEKFARPPHRRWQRFGPATELLDRIARAMALAMKQGTAQRLSDVSRCDRRQRPLRPEALGKIDELHDLRLKRSAAGGGEIDGRLELDRAHRPS